MKKTLSAITKIMLATLVAASLVLCVSCVNQEDSEKVKGEDKVIRIACVGDSLTQGIGATGWKDGDFSRSYPAQLQNILGDGYEVGNFGKGSTYAYYYEGRDKSLYYPNTAQYSQSNKFDADIVIILLGTNDARVMKSDADKENFRQELYRLCEHYLDLESAPELIILNSITLSRFDEYKAKSSPSFDRREPRLKKYILPAQREVAHDLNCTFLNAYDDLYRIFTEEDSLASDELHPNDYGYKMIAEYIAEAIKDIQK